MSAQATRFVRLVWPLALVLLLIAIALAVSQAAAEVHGQATYGLGRLITMEGLAAVAPVTVTIEPLTCTILETMRITGLSRSKVYEEIGNGSFQALKDGSRTLVTYASIKRRQENLPPATIKPPKSKTSDPETEDARPPP